MTPCPAECPIGCGRQIAFERLSYEDQDLPRTLLQNRPEVGLRIVPLVVDDRQGFEDGLHFDVDLDMKGPVGPAQHLSDGDRQNGQQGGREDHGNGGQHGSFL